MPEFHIHIDAATLSPELESFALTELGFRKSDFIPPHAGAESFQPERHLTLKPSTGPDFKRSFDSLISAVKRINGLDGFIEGEVVGNRRGFASTPYDPRIPLPFRICRTELAPGGFRESELHIRMMENGSHPLLMRNLEAMGFFTARTPKPKGTAVLFTAQGKRRDVAAVIDLVSDYLKAAGGCADCTLKEERIVRYWLSRPDVPMPPVIGAIERLVG